MVAPYFQGAEIQDFASFTANVSNDTTAAGFNSSNAQGSMMIVDGSEFSRSLVSYPFSASECWVHFTMNCNNPSTFFGYKFFALSIVGTRRIALGQSSDGSGMIRAYCWDGAAWQTIGTGPASSLVTTRQIFNMFVKIGNPGEFRLFRDGIQIIAAIPDLSFGGAGNFDLATFYNAGSGGGNFHRLSEVIVAPWNTVGSKLVTRIPDANGAHTEWAGSGFGAIDELVPAVDFMLSDTVGERISVLLTDFPALVAGESIAAVKVTTNQWKDLTGPQEFNHFVRISSTDYHGADTALDISISTVVSTVFDEDPAATDDWTPTVLNATEFGVWSRT